MQYRVRLHAWASRDSASVKPHLLVACAGTLTKSTARPAISVIEITAGRSSRFSRALTRSVAGIGSSSVSLAKIANIDPSRGSSTASVWSIRSSARCCRAGKLIALDRPSVPRR